MLKDVPITPKNPIKSGVTPTSFSRAASSRCPFHTGFGAGQIRGSRYAGLACGPETALHRIRRIQRLARGQFSVGKKRSSIRPSKGGLKVTGGRANQSSALRLSKAYPFSSPRERGTRIPAAGQPERTGVSLRRGPASIFLTPLRQTESVRWHAADPNRYFKHCASVVFALFGEQ